MPKRMPLKRELQRFGVRQPACRALADAQYGIGGLLAVAIWSELGDCHRFSRSRQAVRHTGLDVAVDASDRRRAGGYLSRQGPQTLRWALYEAAKNSSHQRSPDHAYYARGQGTSRRQDRRDRGRTSVHPPLLSRPAQPRSRRRLRDPDLTLSRDGAGRLFAHQGQLRSAPAMGMLTSTRAGQPHNTDAIALPLGGHPNTIVVADDTTFVEHRGNAGRPHAAANHPSAHPQSTSFVFASLQDHHVDRNQPEHRPTRTRTRNLGP